MRAQHGDRFPYRQIVNLDARGFPVAFAELDQILQKRSDRYLPGFGLFGSEWNWDAYYQLGTTESSETGYNITAKARYSAALDAVVDPVPNQAV